MTSKMIMFTNKRPEGMDKKAAFMNLLSKEESEGVTIKDLLEYYSDEKFLSEIGVNWPATAM